MWVLIVIIEISGVGGASIAMHDFTSQEACKAAAVSTANAIPTIRISAKCFSRGDAPTPSGTLILPYNSPTLLPGILSELSVPR